MWVVNLTICGSLKGSSLLKHVHERIILPNQFFFSFKSFSMVLCIVTNDLTKIDVAVSERKTTPVSAQYLLVGFLYDFI